MPSLDWSPSGKRPEPKRPASGKESEKAENVPGLPAPRSRVQAGDQEAAEKLQIRADPESEAPPDDSLNERVAKLRSKRRAALERFGPKATLPDATKAAGDTGKEKTQ